MVSCLEEVERDEVAFLGEHFEALFLPLRDGVREALPLSAFSGFVSGAGRRSRVLVHCQVGVSRSASLATAHVMQTEGLRFFEAYKHVRSRRPQVLPNVGFATQLQRLERRLFDAPRDDGHASLTRYLHQICRVPVDIDMLEDMLVQHDHDAERAIRAIFGDEIPRVVQGVRV